MTQAPPGRTHPGSWSPFARTRGYCVRCRGVVAMQNSVRAASKNGRPAARVTCSSSGDCRLPDGRAVMGSFIGILLPGVLMADPFPVGCRVPLDPYTRRAQVRQNPHLQMMCSFRAVTRVRRPVHDRFRYRRQDKRRTRPAVREHAGRLFQPFGRSIGSGEAAHQARRLENVRQLLPDS